MLRTGKGFPAMIAEQESRAIKVAFRLLVEDVGGVEAASAALGYPPGRISEAYALHTQRAPRVDHARRLEALADNPRVTATLARLAGCTLLPQPRLSGDAGLAIAAVLRGAGELGGRAATAMGDGVVDDAERAGLVDQIGALQRALAHAAAVLAGPALPVIGRKAA
jgi:hypothetical protein